MSRFKAPVEVIRNKMESPDAMSIILTDRTSIWDILRRAPSFILSLFLVRYILIKCVFRPFGLYINLNAKKPKRVEQNATLEKLYQTEGTKATKNERLGEIARLESMTLNEAKTWLRQRFEQDEEPDLDKFNYECWMTTYYLFFNVYGFLILRNKKWFWNVEDCWLTFTSSRNEDSDMTLYFNASFAFFTQDTLVLLFKNYERKDYYIIRIHHIVSAVLLLLGWHFNMIRIGALLLFLSELVTPFPYVSRLARRIQSTLLADASFLLFALLWLGVRIYLAHFWILPSYVNYRIRVGKITFRDVLTDSFITIVAMVNFKWTWVILRKFKKVFLSGKYDNPLRALSLALAKRG